MTTSAKNTPSDGTDTTRRPLLRAMLAAFLVACALVCAGCGVRSEGASFTSRLDGVDALIASGDVAAAVRMLDDAAKHAYSAYSRLGVYRRYMLLGEADRAEKTLVKGLKKLPQNPELSAVYANFLLRQGRLDEALSVSQCLAGGQYGSFYAEAALRLAAQGRPLDDVLSGSQKGRKKSRRADPAEQDAAGGMAYADSRLIPLYADAWAGSRDFRWGADAATLLMVRGDTQQAASLRPRTFGSAKEMLFWALVLYDAGMDVDCLDVLLGARERSSAEVGRILSSVSSATPAQREEVADALELEALLADVYYLLGSDDASEATRAALLERLTGLHGSLVPERFAGRVMPLVYLNSISHARAGGDVVRQYALVADALSRFGSSRDVLAAYGQFALDAMSRPPEDALLTQLRQAGLRTQGMEQSDAVPQVALSDALQKIDDALLDRDDANLVVLRKMLQDAGSDERIERKIAGVWRLLEQEEQGTNLYPDAALSYALYLLVKGGSEDEARRLFDRTLGQKATEELTPWQAEYAAYFAATAGQVSAARSLYTALIDAYSSRSMAQTAGQNEAVVNAYVNLATICASTFQDARAVELLNQASGRTTDVLTKAEILYRLAVLHHGSGDVRNTIRSLQYALVLDPSMGKARLMLKEVSP